MPREHVARLWPLAKPFIRAAMERGQEGCFHELEEAVLSDRALLWFAWDGTVRGACVTQAIELDCGLVCFVQAMGGDLECLALLSEIEDYARKRGCVAVRIYGRKGWQRVLRDYKAPRVILEKELT